MIRRIGLDKNKRRTVISPSIYEGGNYVVVDFETSSIEYGSALNLQNNLVLACWYCSASEQWKYKFGQEWEQKELLEDIQKADFIVAQNAKFELGWLDRIGLDLHDVVVWDTMLAEWVILGNRKLPKDLNSMLLRRGLKGKEDVVGGMIKLGIDCNSIPKNLLQTYCTEDVRGTLELFHAQLKEVQERNQLHLVFSRCLLTPVLTDIEKQGINLDHKAVEEEYQAVRQERDKAEQALQSFGTINWNSKKQLAQFLYEELGFAEATDHQGNPIRTGGGSRSCTSSTISQLKASNKQQREFLAAYLQLAKLNTKLSKSLEFFRVVCNERNGIFYGSFNQGSTGTHRLSSSGKRIVGLDGVEYSAQLQNIPREYKRFVLPREEGWRIVEADGCYTAGANVLLANGSSLRVENVVVGDELIGVEEYPSGQGADRKSSVAKVVAIKTREANCIAFDLGSKTVTVSEEHPFLARRKRHRVWQWMTAKDLMESPYKDFQLRRFEIPTLTDNDRALGKLAAYIDGEGCWSWDKCQISQQCGTDVYEDIKTTLEEVGIPYTVKNSRMSGLSTKPVASFTITGTRNLLALQAQVRPVKASRNPRLIWEGKALLSPEPFNIVGKQRVGAQTVYSIQTSTSTYIAEELFNHNCQLEFRVAADMGHDEVAYKEISNDEDIHSETAKVFLADGTHPDFKGLDIKAARQPAKPQTFKPLYGGKGQHRAEKQYCKFFQDKYKQIYKTQTGWTLDVLKNKELRTPYGLVFYWPDTTMGRSGYVSNTTSIFNYPIQGFATAEIIPIVLVSLWHKLRGHNVRLILTVHDSIVMEVGPDVDMEWLEDLIARAFTEDVYEFLRRVYGYEFWVPLGAEIKAGAFWGDGKGKKMKMFPDKGELIWQ